MRQVSLSELAAMQLQPPRYVVPFFLDLRGNALSLKSSGHIHHPSKLSTALAWASLVEKLLESINLGLRAPLRATWFAFAAKSQVGSTQAGYAGAMLLQPAACSLQP